MKCSIQNGKKICALRTKWSYGDEAAGQKIDSIFSNSWLSKAI